MGEKVGKVKLYDKKKGYGFITSDKTDYFFSYKDIIAKHRHCYGGERVSFKPQEGRRASEVKAV